MTTMGDVRHFALRIGRALRPGRRSRLPLVLVIGTSLVSVTAAVSGAASAPAGVRLAAAGRWFASPADNLIYHVNGSAQTIDARVRIDGMEPGTEVVQGETTGYVVGSDEIIEFGQATLAVEQTLTAPAGERPVAVEARGGPYLVYRETGTVVRLAPSPAPSRPGGRSASRSSPRTAASGCTAPPATSCAGCGPRPPCCPARPPPREVTPAR